MEQKELIPAKPLTWDSFMMMPREEQEGLLRYITDRFNIGTSAIANDLFHVSQHTLYRYIRREKLAYPTSRGGRIPDAVMLEWKKWVESISKPEPLPASGQNVSTALPEGLSVDGTANSVGDVVRTMHDLYGRIRVTISIEPT